MNDSKKQPSRRLIGKKPTPQDRDADTLSGDISIIRSDISEIKDVLAAMQYQIGLIRAALDESDDGS